jgi:hypothetical protein
VVVWGEIVLSHVLPPLFDEAVRLLMVIARRAERGEASWGALIIEDRHKMGEALDVLTKAADKRNFKAQYN